MTQSALSPLPMALPRGGQSTARVRVPTLRADGGGDSRSWMLEPQSPSPRDGYEARRGSYFTYIFLADTLSKG
jgi:hypothetical protein